MHDFAWGYDDASPLDPRLALVEAAVQADAAEREAHDEVDADVTEIGTGIGFEDGVDEPLPAFYDNFRRKARINTYTVIGGELAFDDYPFYTPPPQLFPTTFGVNSVRTRTLLGEQGD